MARYELLAGIHDEQGEDKDGNPIVTTYTEGCVVESDKPLDELFPNKFRNLDDPKEKKKEGTATVRRSSKVGDQVRPQTVGIPKTGPGHGAGQKPPMPGDRKVVTPEGQEEEGDWPDPAKPKKDKKAAEESEDGETDVTADFPKAKDADLVVKKGKGGYSVYDADATDEELNKSPLKTEKQVNEFVRKYHA